NGLNPADASDRNLVTLSGYTALEVYLNSLVGETIELKFATAVPEMEIKGLKLFPTVGPGTLTLSSSEPLAYAEVISINGASLKSFGLNGATSSQLGYHQAGSYLLKIRSESGKTQHLKFFVL
ncbi:MAG: hypothetical protein LWW91_04995, partial [Bacteroidales bacterium]|nr:hypothetical protein [Bacteroidales bacterium]